MEVTSDGLARFFSVVLPHLNEVQRRVVAGATSEMFGRGGKSWVADASGMSRNTVIKAEGEVAAGITPQVRLRAPGAGAKPLTELQPGLLEALDQLVHPDTRGNPMSLLRWTSKSTAKLAGELTRRGFTVSDDTVGRLLKRLGYSLLSPAKVKEGAAHPDRDGQFRYLHGLAREFTATGDPVISVDTKKKELVGEYKNAGRQWRPAGEPTRVKDHDFPDPDLGKANPYGVYDIAANTGWVAVGTDHDTAAFAVSTIRAWFDQVGNAAYPGATKLLICADGGGSNGYRLRAWKTELAALADQSGLSITVCHLPPGTSKWNKIEHRLFSHISMNWRGRPLTSHQVIVDLIGATTTATGLSVHAELDNAIYPTGIKISDAQLAALPITRHDFHGDWNYTLTPTDSP